MTRQGSPASAPRGPLWPPSSSPRSVAVVGASDDPAKWGHILSRRALESGATRPVALVNRSGGEVLGPADVPPRWREARRGARRAAGPRGGLRPGDRVRRHGRRGGRGRRPRGRRHHRRASPSSGAEGARVEAEAVAVARAAGAVLVGPNCLGIADTGAGLQLSHAVLPAGRGRRAQPERQPGARPRGAARRARPRDLAVRLAGQPGRPHRGRPDARLRRPRRHPRGRDLRRGRRRRPRLRLGRAGAGRGRASRSCCSRRAGPTRPRAARSRTPAR